MICNTTSTTTRNENRFRCSRRRSSSSSSIFTCKKSRSVLYIELFLSFAALLLLNSMHSMTLFTDAFTPATKTKTLTASKTSILNRNPQRYYPSTTNTRTRYCTSTRSCTSTSTRTHAYGINHQEEQIFNDLDVIYTDASKSIKCPFWRRRVADSIDNIAMVLKFLIIRHKSIIGDVDELVSKLNRDVNANSNANVDLDLDLDMDMDLNADLDLNLNLNLKWNSDLKLEVRPGCKSIGVRNPDGSIYKHLHLSMEELKNIIQGDWSTTNDRGYYITGRLSTEIYRDDCLFDGPDPDMPVRGLRKYLAAASHLFEAKNSFATLHGLTILERGGGGAAGVEEGDNIIAGTGAGAGAGGVIKAEWTLGGVLMLPWRPKVKPWSGWTKYHFDEDGLIYYHEEGWDISVWEAFIGTMFPELWERISGSGSGSDSVSGNDNSSSNIGQENR